MEVLGHSAPARSARSEFFWQAMSKVKVKTGLYMDPKSNFKQISQKAVPLNYTEKCWF